MKVSIVIPAFNEAENISFLLSEISQATIFSTGEFDCEIIVVDDASTDNTFAEASSFANSPVTVLRLSRRSGSHVAIRAGLDIATGAAVICLAADGQDDPAVIEQMLQKWNNGADIVWALRHHRQEEKLINSFLAMAFYRLLTFFGAGSRQIDLSRADFYLLDRKVVEALKSCPERNTSLFGLIAWLGFNQEKIEYDRRQRKAGVSKWNFKSRLRLALDWVIAFTGIPLKLVTLTGFLIAFLGFLYAIIVISRSLILGNPVQGWSSVMTAILLLGGGQMMMLGIIGEYLWRTLDESRNRPCYFISKKKLPNTE